MRVHVCRRELSEETRWVIPPNGTVNLVVQFASETVGRFSEVLVFDVLNGEKTNKVTVMASCDYPRINTEARYRAHVVHTGMPNMLAGTVLVFMQSAARPSLLTDCGSVLLLAAAGDGRNLYYKTAKIRPSTPNVKQQFIVPSSMFEFGPLLAGRDRTGYLTGCYPEHTAKFRITNSGLFPVHADFWLKSEGPAAEGASADSKKKPGEVLTERVSIPRHADPCSDPQPSSGPEAGCWHAAVPHSHTIPSCAVHHITVCSATLPMNKQLSPSHRQPARRLPFQPARSCCTRPACSWPWRRQWS